MFGEDPEHYALIEALPGYDPRGDVIDREELIECCHECGDDILTMRWKGTGLCSGNCEKARDERLTS